MKQSEARDFLPFVQAWAGGKTLQYDNGSYWMDIEYAEFNNPVSNYRIKPEPKLRPWRPEEVPVGAVIRDKTAKIPGLIVGLTTTKRIQYIGDHDVVSTSREQAAEYWEHSLDHGKTWLPCGAMH